LAVALINPPVNTLPPVILAVALINPPVVILPPITLAVADKVVVATVAGRLNVVLPLP